MSFPGTTFTTVFGKLAGRLRADVNKLGQDFKDIVIDSIARAGADIRLLMCSQGYLPSDLDGWSDGQVYVERLALYYALSDTRVLRNYPGLDDKALDPRPMLTDLGMIISNGRPIAPTPGGSPVGGIMSGDSVAGQKAAVRYERRIHGWSG